MEKIKQQILNRTLHKKEMQFFTTKSGDIEERKDLVEDMVRLIVLGAIPTNYNMYGEVIRTLKELEESLIFSLEGYRDEVFRYLNSILDGESTEIRNNFYNALINAISWVSWKWPWN